MNFYKSDYYSACRAGFSRHPTILAGNSGIVAEVFMYFIVSLMNDTLKRGLLYGAFLMSFFLVNTIILIVEPLVTNGFKYEFDIMLFVCTIMINMIIIFVEWTAVNWKSERRLRVLGNLFDTQDPAGQWLPGSRRFDFYSFMEHSSRGQVYFQDYVNRYHTVADIIAAAVICSLEITAVTGFALKGIDSYSMLCAAAAMIISAPILVVCRIITSESKRVQEIFED